MKTVAKIIACLVWFTISLLLSALFFRLVICIEDRVGIFFGMRIWVLLISWFVFVALMAWLPVWVTRRRALNLSRLMAKTAAFLLSLLACTILCTIIWGDFVEGKLYNCTDSVPFDFLRPGDWVHSHDGLPVAVVPKINPSDSMSMPDSIKEGWSVPKLWCLWCSFIAVSIAISVSLLFLIFSPLRTKVAQTISP
jgi:hypothetical protein